MRQPRGIALLLFAIALVAHFGYFALGHSHLMPGDSRDYLDGGRSLLDRGTILDSDGLPQTRRGPGYVPVVALLDARPFALTALNHVFGALCAPLTFFLALPLSRRIAVFAGSLVALHPDVVVWSDFVLSESFFLVVMLAALLLVQRSRYALAGLLLGYAVVTRPIAVLVPVALALTLFRKRRAAAVLLACGYLFPLLWIARNRMEAGAAVLTSTAGENLLLWRAGGAVAMQDRGFTLSLLPSEREDALRHHLFAEVQPGLGRLALNEARARYGPHPTHLQTAEVSRSMGRQLILTTPIGFIESTFHAFVHMLCDPAEGWPFLGLALAVPLALLALAGSLQPRFALFSATLWSLVITTAGPEAATYTRFRLPLLPLMAILAAAAVDSLLKRVPLEPHLALRAPARAEIAAEELAAGRAAPGVGRDGGDGDGDRQGGPADDRDVEAEDRRVVDLAEGDGYECGRADQHGQHDRKGAPARQLLAELLCLHRCVHGN
jgi:hypothetical protein